MVLTLDIQKKAAPITIVGWRQNQNLGDELNDLILLVEGFDNHVFAMNKASAKNLLDGTNKVISAFIAIEEEINTLPSSDNEVAERFRYALKALYKLKSLLHIAYTKDIPVGKTPDRVREGLSAISRAATLQNLSKHTH